MEWFPALPRDVSFAAALSARRCYPTARALRRLGGACGVAQTIPESRAGVSSAAAILADATGATHFATWLDNGARPPREAVPVQHSLQVPRHLPRPWGLKRQKWPASSRHSSGLFAPPSKDRLAEIVLRFS